MINKLSGYTAWELMERHGMDVNEYWPRELLDLVGKRFILKIYFSDYNINNNNHTYRCDAVNDDPEFIKHFKDGFMQDEDSKDDFTTPANKIKVNNFTNDSLNRVLEMPPPSIEIGASGSGSVSGSKVNNFTDNSLNRVFEMRTPSTEMGASRSASGSGSKRVFIYLDEIDSEDEVEGCNSLNIQKIGNHNGTENYANPNVAYTSTGPEKISSSNKLDLNITSITAGAVRGRTRTPTQVSPLSKGNDIFVTESTRIKSTPRPRGRPRLTNLSTCTQFQNVTPVGSLTFKSTIDNGTVTDKQSFNKTAAKGKSIRQKHESRFMSQTPVTFDLESPSTKQVRLSCHQSSLLTSDRRQELKGKMATRQFSCSGTQFQNVTPVGSLTFKSTIDNGKSVRQKHESRFISQTPITFDLESPSTKQVRLSSHRSSLLTSDRRHELKGKMATRQSARRINFTESVHTKDKKEKNINLLEFLKRVCEEQPINVPTHTHCVVVEVRFAFTSMGGKQDTSVNVGQGPYCYRLHGENYHLAGPLLPADGKPAKFAQLNGESSSSRNKELDNQLTIDIRDLLDEINPLVQDFRIAGERIRSSYDEKKISFRLIGTRQRDGRPYNLPTASEVAALIVGDFDSTEHKRDIILHCQDGDFKRISELHPSYLALHYPLFFPYGEDNYRSDIFHEGQFIVDAYTMIESERLTFNRKNDKDLRSETYSKLATLVQNSDSGVKLRGKKVILNSNFTGSPLVYPIEFQKRGLSHCHILLWLKTEDKITTTRKIDEYISTEIPNKDEDPELYQLVTDHMMHGPCGADNPSCPCTIEYKCTKKFPRQFNETTVIDDSGYALYKRRNDGNIIKKSGTDLHNGYVVPYNPGLLRRYQAHINVDRCNQVIFDATESIDYVVDKSSVNETKFKSWMELNQTDPFARTLLYVEIPKFYVWNQKQRIWTRRKQVRGPMEWDDLKKVDDVLYPTYRDACYARGLLQDDKEYIDGILEASLWGMGDYLRSIFVMLIMTDSMSWPKIVWEKRR
ncbi:putative PIF1 DNA helicase/replication protein A1-like protein [Tanacetum coccineum]